VRAFDVQVIPGQLQCPEYVWALLSTGRYHSREEMEREAEERWRRQDTLNGEGAPVFWAVLDEAALRRPVRAAGTLADRHHAKATGSTIRRNLINIPARIATSARRIRLHLPENWPWSPGFLTLWARTGHQPITT